MENSKIYNPKDLSKETHEARLKCLKPPPGFTDSPVFIVNNCHITLEAFLRFLTREHNSENLRCLLELKAIRDYVKKEKSKQEKTEDNQNTDYEEEGDADSYDETYSEMTEDDDDDDNENKSEQRNDYFAIVLKGLSFWKKWRSQGISGKISDELNEAILAERIMLLLMNRCITFYRDYIEKDSPHEVNISGKTRNQLESDYSALGTVFKTYREEREKIKDNSNALMKSVSDVNIAINMFMDQLESELFKNLMDPFSRFLSSVEFRESMATFFAMADDSSHRMKLLGPQKEGVVLNAFKKDSIERNPTKVAEYLLNCWRFIIKEDKYWIQYEHHTDFNYESLRGKDGVNIHLEHYKKAVGDLQSVKIHLMSEEETTAFFINIYNCLILHTIIVLQGVPSSDDIWKKVQSKAQYDIGGKLMSLKDIRNTLKVEKKLLGTTRPELLFCLITATKESPTLRLYHAKELKQEIKEAARQYVENHVQFNSHPKRGLTISFPNLFARHYNTIQNGLQDIGKNKSEFVTIISESLNRDQKNRIESCKKLRVNVGLPHVLATDFSFIHQTHVDPNGLSSLDFIKNQVP